MEDIQVIEIVNRNHDLREFADRLNAISARRKRKRGVFFAQALSRMRRKS